MSKQLKDAEKQGVNGLYLRGNVAPRVLDRSGKPYIEWLVYTPGRYGGRKT
jgi:hypothetical protein